MMKTYDKSQSTSAHIPEVRVIYVYCLMLFDTSSGKKRVWTYDSIEDLINDFESLSADSTLFPSVFVHRMLVTTGHPLFDSAQPLYVRNKEVILKK